MDERGEGDGRGDEATAGVDGRRSPWGTKVRATRARRLPYTAGHVASGPHPP